jgi:hypothetical protein
LKDISTNLTENLETTPKICLFRDSEYSYILRSTYLRVEPCDGKCGRRGLTRLRSTQARRYCSLRVHSGRASRRPPFLASQTIVTIPPLGLAFAAVSASEMELHLCLRLHVRLTPAAKPPPAPAVLPVPASRRLRMGND